MGADDNREKVLVAKIETQTQILFQNVENILAFFHSHDSESGYPWATWRHIYHLLHSMDQWFISPFTYRDHRDDGFDIAAIGTEGNFDPISIHELNEYFNEIRGRTMDYLQSIIDDNNLSECPDGSSYTRLELILGQFRHVMYHVGMIHGDIKARYGVLLEFAGLSPTIRPK